MIVTFKPIGNEAAYFFHGYKRMIGNFSAYREGVNLGTFHFEAISELLKEPKTFVWLDIYAPNRELLLRVQEEFSLHDLAIEDALHASHGPSLAAYGESVFINLEEIKMVNLETRINKVYFFLGSNFLVSVRHGSSVDYSSVRVKAEATAHRLNLGPGFVFYSLMEFLLDTVQPVVESLQQRFQDLEKGIVMETFDRVVISQTYKLKKDVFLLKDPIGSVADVSGQLIRLHGDIISKELRPFMQDIVGRVACITKSLDNIQDMLSSSIQVNLALVSLAQNEVVKRLAGWGAILAIPTVVFSMYGMNFQFMPELGQPLGYPLVLGLTTLLCLLIYRRLVRAHWI